MPKVTVLMPSFNYAQYLPTAIRSVLSQSYSDLELVITDDCSTDGSREIAEEWKRLDDRVVTVFHDVNRGLAAARNSGLAASSGDFIAFCDADDIWLPQKLAVQMGLFCENSEVGLVYSDSAIIDSLGACTGQTFSSLVHKKKQETSGYLFEQLCERNFVCIPTVTARREAVEYASGFDERLRSLEDWVCWTRLAKKYPFLYVDRPLVHYRIHGASLSQNRRNMARNRISAIELLFVSFRDIPPRAMSKMFYALGVSHLEIGDSRRAARAFANSVKTCPLRVRSWARLFQSFLCVPTF